jgi:hypothetical protein
MMVQIEILLQLVLLKQQLDDLVFIIETVKVDHQVIKQVS